MSNVPGIKNEFVPLLPKGALSLGQAVKLLNGVLVWLKTQDDAVIKTALDDWFYFRNIWNTWEGEAAWPKALHEVQSMESCNPGQ